MSDVVLNQDELNQLKLRSQLVSQKNLEIQILRNEYKVYTDMMLKGKGLDPEKDYDIDDRGVVSERKAEPEKDSEKAKTEQDKAETEA